MLSVNAKSQYKNFAFSHSLNSRFQRKKILNSSIIAPCLDRYSVIHNFFSQPDNYVYLRSIPSLDISHSRDVSPFKNPNIQFLPDQDFIASLLSDFSKYNKYHEVNPVIASCSLPDKQFNFRLFTRFENPLRNIRVLSHGLDNYTGKGVFLTLTYAHTITLRNAWLTVSHDWNNFLNRLVLELRKNPYQTHLYKHKNRNMVLTMDLDYYKGVILPSHPDFSRSDLHYIMVLEAQGNGFPHIHALFLGIDWLFYAGNKQEWLADNPHSKNLKHFWGHGGIFVNKTASGSTVKNPIRYMMKYIRKIWDDKPDYKATLTQSFLWYFSLNSFNTSRNLKSYLSVVEPSDNPIFTMFYRSKTMVSTYDLDLFKSDFEPSPVPDLVFEGLDLFKKLSGEYKTGSSSDYTPIIWVEKPVYSPVSVPFHSSQSVLRVNPVKKRVSNRVLLNGVYHVKPKTTKRVYDWLFVDTFGLLEYGFNLSLFRRWVVSLRRKENTHTIQEV